MQLHDYFTHKRNLHIVNCTIKDRDKHNGKHKLWCF